MPLAKGASGPITVSSILFSRVTLTSLSMSVGLIGRFWAIVAVPALPGATYISLTLGLWASFHTSVCSLAPPPTTSIFS
jgi:hypothetical protein